MTLAGRSAAAVLTLLLLSLAANLFVGGLLIGRGGLWPREPRPIMRHEGGSGGLGSGLAALVPPAARPIIEERLAERRAELDQRLEAMRAARRAAFARLRAEPFDAAATREAFAALRDRGREVQELVQGLLIDTAERTPADVRAGWRPFPRRPDKDRDPPR